MTTPSFQEDHISQIPALQMLMKMGYIYLSPEEALAMRGGKTGNVLLEDVLRTQLSKNKPRISSTKTVELTATNIEEGIRALKELPLQEGMIMASEKAYELVTLGHSVDQIEDGVRKSLSLHYIDWENWENNAFHVTEEYSVMRSTSKDHYRPDLVLFVNGIPLCIIECKRPDMKDPIKQAISQHLRNQQEDGIRALYVYAQMLLSISANEGRYATLGTKEKFWAHWEEKFSSTAQEDEYTKALAHIKNQPLSNEQRTKLYGERYAYVVRYFNELEKEYVEPTEQDKYLFGLCSPMRLLDFVYNFTLYDNGEKKIARYQQYFAIKKAMKQIVHVDQGRRKGGVIWHTQGSGKSLTMVMLAEAIGLEKRIKNPKIILVTDRTDLDDQITKTFKKCKIPVINAATGQRLTELLQGKSDAVITTIINKFETAVKRLKEPLTSHNIFVLVDEGHRSQHGTFNIDMQKSLPNACFIAFTGTPLFKKDKSTIGRFGTLIDDYTVDKAVQDKAVVPLLYEGRYPKRTVHEKPIDEYFERISEPLTDYQKADLKRKMSRADHLNEAEQLIYAQAWDISLHFRDNFQSTPFKGQLVCSKKESAIKYKSFLDEIGIVTSEVVISPPDDREGEENAYGETSDKVKSFWKKMMDEHSSADKYQKNIVNRYKNTEQPEIIIVVDKLLTGFDAPQNTVLYITRNLRGHTLLQAIARVNRIYPDKDYGYIIDYYGVLGELDEALEVYSSFAEFDDEDLAGTLTVITKEIEKLPQAHSDLWDTFKTIQNKKDVEAYQLHLKDEAIRTQFYNRLTTYARILKMALSSIDFHNNTEDKKIASYKSDLKFFMNLRTAVMQRYSDSIDYKQFEGQIQKLIDTHIQTDEIQKITELVNIFEKDAFKAEVEKTLGEAAKADKIASRTSKHISEKMDEDPAFYKKFSELLKDTIRAYEEKRISELEYLNKVKEIMEQVLARTDSDIPVELENKDVARAFYGVSLEGLEKKVEDVKMLQSVATELALRVDEIILEKLMVDWQNNVDVVKKLMLEIGDYIIDEVRDKYGLKMSFEEIDVLSQRMVEIAKIRYKK